MAKFNAPEPECAVAGKMQRAMYQGYGCMGEHSAIPGGDPAECMAAPPRVRVLQRAGMPGAAGRIPQGWPGEGRIAGFGMYRNTNDNAGFRAQPGRLARVPRGFPAGSSAAGTT